MNSFKIVAHYIFVILLFVSIIGIPLALIYDVFLEIEQRLTELTQK